ncbi:MAG: acyl-CoA dehydrogenase family protein, partial [Pseudomonadota bacterium]
MPTFTAPTKDQQFVLHDLLKIAEQDVPGYADLDREFTDAILTEAGKLATEVLQPLNASGDKEGCKLENGVVRVPAGFQEAWDQMAEGGWMAIDMPEEYGGQGLPYIMHTAAMEPMVSANMAFQMYPGLSHGNMAAILANGSEEQKQTYLPKMASGEWSGTMNLTEPHCGTDLGLMRTKAVPQGDGTYKISGQKIWISAGEHEMSENIIHLVLAKIPGGPEGVKGIS